MSLSSQARKGLSTRIRLSKIALCASLAIKWWNDSAREKTQGQKRCGALMSNAALGPVKVQERVRGWRRTEAPLPSPETQHT